MQKIDGTTIKLNRGDVLNLTLSVKINGTENYTFQVGDEIVFSVYNKGKMDQEAVVLKRIVIAEECQSVSINLTSEETKLGEMKNKPVEYWYEVELNNQYTIIGYDDAGEKQLMLYPEGSKIV